VDTQPHVTLIKLAEEPGIPVLTLNNNMANTNNILQQGESSKPSRTNNFFTNFLKLFPTQEVNILWSLGKLLKRKPLYQFLCTKFVTLICCPHTFAWSLITSSSMSSSFTYIHIYYIPWIHKLVRWPHDAEKVIIVQYVDTSAI
jgi:hypothetical protein